MAIDLRFMITRTVMVNVGVMDEKQQSKYGYAPA